MAEHLPCKQRVGGSNPSTGFDNMKKETGLPMKFNEGLKKYEPELPVRESNKKIKFNWLKFLLILLGIIAVGVVLYLVLV